MKLFLEMFRLRKKTFLAILALAVANLALFCFIVNSQQPELETFQNNLLEARNRTPRTAVNEATTYAQGKRDLATFRAMIAPKRDFTRVIGELFETAANNSLGIGGISYKPETAKGAKGMLLYSLTLDVTGKYAAVKSFLMDLERIKEILVIDRISLNSSTDKRVSVNMKLNLSAYFATEGQ